MVPDRKVHLAQDRYKYLPKTVFYTLIEFWASIFISSSEIDNSIKEQELRPILCMLPHVNGFCNRKVIRKNTDCLTIKSL